MKNKNNVHGISIHGLWPNYSDGSYPTFCKLVDFDLVDVIIPEPLGGAHRDHGAMTSSLKMNLITMLDELSNIDISEILSKRKQKIGLYGKFEAS